MLPHQGQGANQTIEDAAVLAAELDGARDIGVALRRYAHRRRVRTRQVQLMSWAASAALHLPDGPAARRRDAELAGLPERVAFIHGYDALAEAGSGLAHLSHASWNSDADAVEEQRHGPLIRVLRGAAGPRWSARRP
jgi:salicylate hydroxylase